MNTRRIATTTLVMALILGPTLTALAGQGSGRQYNPDRQRQSRMSPRQQTGGQTRQRTTQVTGTIQNIRRFRLGGQQYVFAKLQTQQGQIVVASLGPASRFQQLNLSQGDRVRVAGRQVRVNDRPVVMTDRLQTANRQVRVESPSVARTRRMMQGRAPMDRQQYAPGARQPMERRQMGQRRQMDQQYGAGGRRQMDQITGTIRATRQFALDGRQYTFAKLQTQQGQTVVAALGPASRVRRLNLSQGDRVQVRGRRARVNERSVLMAMQVRTGNQRLNVQPPRPRRRQQQGRPQAQRGQQARR